MSKPEFERLLNDLVIAGVATATARDSDARAEAHAEFERLRHSVVTQYDRATTERREPPFKPPPASTSDSTRPKRKRGKCADCGTGCGSFYRCKDCNAKYKKL